MKIAVDSYEVIEHSTGVGRVIDNIFVHLVKILPEYNFFVFTREKIERYSTDNVRQHVIHSRGGYFRWQNGLLVKKLKEIEPDILIASNYTLPFFNKWKSILFEFDVSFASHPEWFSKKEAIMKKFLVKRSLKKAAVVVTGSEFSKAEIVKNFNVNPEVIKIITLGIADKFQRSSKDKISEWKEQKGLKGKKIIGYLGSIFNRRNLPLLVESINLIRNELAETVLYIIGKDLTYPSQNIVRLLNKDWIKWDQAIKDAELPLFYSSLDAFAYLSEYEGFGLPPLEALACGTVPVLLNRTSLKEIYQGVAVMVDAPEVIKTKKALKTAMTDRKRKQAILKRFYEKKSQFSWAKAAEEVSLILKNL